MAGEHNTEDLLNQITVEQLRADEAEQKLKDTSARADKAEAERDEAREMIKKLEKERADNANVDVKAMEQKIKTLTTLNTQLKTRLDAAQKPDTINARVKDRVEIEARARKVLPAETRFDGMSDIELMTKAVEALHSVKLEGKSPDYIRARFDAAMESHQAGEAALERVSQIAAENKDRTVPAGRADARTARQKFEEEQNGAWKKTFSRKEAN